MRKQVKVYLEKLNPEVILPVYANLNDSGMDIRATEDIIIHPQETKIIPTGLKSAIPVGYEIQVRPRSGVSFKTPIRISNAPGTIDTGYRGELGIIMTNTSTGYESVAGEYLTLESKGNQQGTYVIKKGDRVCQIVLQEVPEIIWEEVESVKDIGLDRNGGFGSSGIA